jgi:hypothetical protein
VPRRIVDIASAAGWRAQLSTGDPGEPERVVTLVGWALVENDDGTRAVIGLVLRPIGEDAPTGQVMLADEALGFTCYSFGGVRTRPALPPR